MQSLGRHVLAEVYGCQFEVLNDIALVENIMVNAALEAGAEVREVVFHKFSPQGVSGVVVISESHLAILLPAGVGICSSRCFYLRRIG